VHTNSQRIEVPIRREKVRVQRIPLKGEASKGKIGQNEVMVPVTEEEIVMLKRSWLRRR